jgi:hypothetical protein
MSCSSGSDPEDVILDSFRLPANLSILLMNTCNDIAMEINAYGIHNLDKTGTITNTDYPACISVNVNKTDDNLESIVVNYGEAYCASNGGQFKGSYTISPTNAENTQFNISFSNFGANNYIVSGNTKLEIDTKAENRTFSINMDKLQLTAEIENATPITCNFNSSYEFVDNFEDKLVSIFDDIYSFESDIELIYSENESVDITSSTKSIFSYPCKEIIGGTMNLVIKNIGDGIINFGGGDPTDNCDNKVQIEAVGGKIEIQI